MTAIQSIEQLMKLYPVYASIDWDIGGGDFCISNFTFSLNQCEKGKLYSIFPENKEALTRFNNYLLSQFTTENTFEYDEDEDGEYPNDTHTTWPPISFKHSSGIVCEFDGENLIPVKLVLGSPITGPDDYTPLNSDRKPFSETEGMRINRVYKTTEMEEFHSQDDEGELQTGYKEDAQ